MRIHAAAPFKPTRCSRVSHFLLVTQTNSSGEKKNAFPISSRNRSRFYSVPLSTTSIASPSKGIAGPSVSISLVGSAVGSQLLTSPSVTADLAELGTTREILQRSGKLVNVVRSEGEGTVPVAFSSQGEKAAISTLYYHHRYHRQDSIGRKAKINHLFLPRW